MAGIAKNLAGMQAVERLAEGNSPVHRLHPMAKLLTTLLFVVVVVSFNRYDVVGLIPYLFYPTVLMALSDTPYRPLLKRLAAALPFSLMAGVSNVFFDVDMVVVGGFAMRMGVVSFASILIKTYLTVMATLLLMCTTPPQAINSQLLRLKVPPPLVMQLTMTYRYVGLLMGEASSMYAAYMLRSPGDRGIKMGQMGAFVGQLLLRSMDRAERVREAMLLRGFGEADASGPNQPLRVADWAYLAIVVGSMLIFRLVDVSRIWNQLLM